MLLGLTLLAVGFVLLIKGADWLVSGASVLARSFGVSDLVIGLSIVALGTSMPEFVIGMLANLRGNASLCVANVVGSNIANILLIVGTAALICPLFASRGTVWKEIPLLMLASLVLAVQANDRLFYGGTEDVLSLGDGLVFLAFLSIYLYYMFEISGLGSRDDAAPATREGRIAPMLGLAALGLMMLVAGGNWVVDGAVRMARVFNVSDRLIGLTIVAAGTSLPELATSAVAAWKKNADIAIGNVVGSSILNILFILGVSGLVAPLPVSIGLNVDITAMLAATALLFVVMFVGRPRRQVGRLEGGCFIALYIGYITWLVARG